LTRWAAFTPSTLDAKRGAAAQRLYLRLGWTEAGTISAYALDPDGSTAHDAVILDRSVGFGDDVEIGFVARPTCAT
jgi:hypothetical protein